MSTHNARITYDDRLGRTRKKRKCGARNRNIDYIKCEFRIASPSRSTSFLFKFKFVFFFAFPLASGFSAACHMDGFNMRATVNLKAISIIFCRTLTTKCENQDVTRGEHNAWWKQKIVLTNGREDGEKLFCGVDPHQMKYACEFWIYQLKITQLLRHAAHVNEMNSFRVIVYVIFVLRAQLYVNHGMAHSEAVIVSRPIVP